MSEPVVTIQTPEDGRPARAVVEPADGSRLAELAREFCIAKTNADHAKQRLDQVTAALKVEMVNAAPGANRIELTGDHVRAPLRLLAKVSRRLDSKRMREERPDLWLEYARPVTSWELREIKGEQA